MTFQRVLILYTKKKVTTSLIYKNSNSLIYLYENRNFGECVCVWERERERERGERERESDEIYIYLQRPLLLCASFTRGWYRAALQPDATLTNIRANAQTPWFPRLTAGVENVRNHIFFWRPHISPTQFACFLFTLKHIFTSCFWNPHNLAYQRPLCNINTKWNPNNLVQKFRL